MTAEVEKSLRFDYQDRNQLAVHAIPGGTIYPLEDSGSTVTECGQYGGVLDQNFRFVPASLQRRCYPDPITPSADWYIGARPGWDPATRERCDEEVVFLGPAKRHFAHFYLEALARVWFFLDERNCKYRVAYLVRPGDEPDAQLLQDAFSLLGVPVQNLMAIRDPTQFKTVLIPEQSFVLNRSYHSLYVQTIDRLQKNIAPREHKKVFFSRRLNYPGSTRNIGDDLAEAIFRKNGYEIFHPEGMTLPETLAIMKGCEEFAACSGSNAHNAVFLREGATIVILNRSEHIHPIQTMINEMRRLRCVYVDSFYDLLPVNWSIGPFSFCYTPFLEAYLRENHMAYDRAALIAASTRNLILYIKTWSEYYADSAFTEPTLSHSIDAKALAKKIRHLELTLAQTISKRRAFLMTCYRVACALREKHQRARWWRFVEPVLKWGGRMVSRLSAIGR